MVEPLEEDCKDLLQTARSRLQPGADLEETLRFGSDDIHRLLACWEFELIHLHDEQDRGLPVHKRRHMEHRDLALRIQEADPVGPVTLRKAVELIDELHEREH